MDIRTAAMFAPTPHALQTKHEQAIALMKQQGQDVDVHTVTDPVTAYVNEGRWLFDCLCGSGVLAHPDWPEARCFGCGAVYTSVIFPENREAIEAVLAVRGSYSAMNFDERTESITDLEAENIADGKPVRQP